MKRKWSLIVDGNEKSLLQAECKKKECGWDLVKWLYRESDSQCRSRNCPGFDPSILRHSGIWGEADEVVLNIVHKKKNTKNTPLKKKEKKGRASALYTGRVHRRWNESSCTRTRESRRFEKDNWCRFGHWSKSRMTGTLKVSRVPGKWKFPISGGGWKVKRTVSERRD